MLVTQLGIVTLVREEQPENVLFLMLVTPFGITSSVINSLFKYKLRAYDNGLAYAPKSILHQAARSFICTSLSLVQASNALFPMLVTLLGIVMLVSPQHQNALFPMLVTLFGIVMLVSPVQ